MATLNIGDVIDGGAGTDTLDIYTASTPPVFGGTWANAVQQGTVKNVEIINIHNNTSGLPFGYTVGQVDASGFVGATSINQDTAAEAVINLDASTTAGFSNLATPTALMVQPNDTSASANVALVHVAEGSTVIIQGNPTGILNAVKLSGSVSDINNDGIINPVGLNVTAGKGVQSVAVNTAVKTNLVVIDGTDPTKPVTSVDASASTGGVSYTAGVNVASIKGGSGDDTLTINTATTATVNASVDTGAGKNVVNVNTFGAGTTTVTGGAGSDTVNVLNRSAGVLTLSLGDGVDTFTTAVPINGSDLIDGGAGIDTLTIEYVGAANIGAFKNFEVFDAVGLNHGLDTQILATQNTVTEFITSGATGAGAKLGNIDAGVNFRATGDMGGSSIVLAQKTAGAFTVTLDADSTVNAEHDTFLNAEATNATALTATFGVDSAFVQTAAVKNDATINLAGDKATTLAVVSGGTNATNHLNYFEGNDGAGKGLLTSVTVTGDQNVDISGLQAGAALTQLTSINAAAFTGKLTVDLVDLKAGAGTVTLGSGADTVIATPAGSNAGIGAGGVVNGFESVASFGKASATAVSTTAPAADVAAAQAAADQVELAGASVAANLADNGFYSVKNGVVTFSGAGPTSLTNAVNLLAIDTAEFGAGKAAVFNYLGDSYTFVSDGVAGANAGDTLVKLVGVTGVTNFAATAVDPTHFFIV